MMTDLTLSKVLTGKLYLLASTQTFPALVELNSLGNQLSADLGITCGRIDPEWFPDHDLEESGFESEFFEGALNPTIDRYRWYRGHWFQHSADSGIVLTEPWVHPQESRPSIVLIVGAPPAIWVDNIIDTYVDKETTQLNDAAQNRL